MPVDEKKPRGNNWGGARPRAGRKTRPKRDTTGELLERIGPPPRLHPGKVEPGEHFARFASLFKVTQGARAGQPVELEAWERRFVDEALAVDEHGRRKVTRAGLLIPRKSGKTTLAALLGVYLVSPADGEQPCGRPGCGEPRTGRRAARPCSRILASADPVVADLSRPASARSSATRTAASSSACPASAA
jgi:hypothetical protein